LSDCHDWRVPVLRAAVVAFAVAACVWFAIGIHQAHDVTVATNIVTSAHTSADLARASSALNAAAFLNPDRNVDILRGRVAIARGQVASAQQILRRVTEQEPLNLTAWIWFTGASLADKQAGTLGAQQIARLDPLDARVVGR
jgi:predicted Zn-dependent protease